MEKGIFFGNRIIDIVIISTVVAQSIKIFTPCIKGGKPAISKLFETGGMPSSHSSSVTSLCTAVALICGTNSIEFSISFVFAIIVMYDATGIRREAGKHAKALNQILFEGNYSNDTKEIKEFKEFLGHTPFEVLIGGLLGILIAFLFQGYLV